MTLHNLELGKDLLDMTPKTQKVRQKIDQLDINKTENCFASKNTNKKVKRQVTEKEKLFATHIYDKRTVSRTYKEPLQFNNKRKITIFKIVLNRHFFREEARMANKCMKIHSTSLTIREVQIKTTMYYNFVPTRIGQL